MNKEEKKGINHGQGIVTYQIYDLQLFSPILWVGPLINDAFGFSVP